MSPTGHYFDKATKEIHADRKITQMDNRGIGFALFQKMKLHAKDGLIAQIDAATGHRDSFSSFLSRTIRLAISLKKMGIKEGDKIGLCTYNHMNSAVPYIAGLFLGAIITPTDPTISLEDQRHLLNLVKPKVIFVSNGAEDLIQQTLQSLDFECEIITFALNKGKYRSFQSLIEQNQKDEMCFQPFIVEDPLETCVILFSSGTTGLPKGICLNHYYVMSSLVSTESFREFRSKLLIYSTLYWVSAILLQYAWFYNGLERIVCNSYDPKLLWDYVDEYEVNMIFLAPVQAIQSLRYLKHQKSKTSSLKMLLTGGSALAPTYYQELRDLLPSTFVCNGYGQTEVGFISLFKTIDDDSYHKLLSVGYLATNMIAKIVDPETEEPLDLNQKGELYVKTPYPMNGYYNQDSSSVWDKEGFIKTGDIGYFDDDLCLFLTDRIKEMFKYMSWHIVPTKLEAILQSHPSVELAIVVGIPHPTEDNHACGAVTLVKRSNTSREELENYVAERVDERNRLRAGVVILEKMPMTPTGKIMRREVKDILKKTVILRS